MSGHRSAAARDLVKDIQRAGGIVERTGRGKLKVTGPDGSATIYEPSDESRKDLQRSSARKLLAERTGLRFQD